MTGLEALQAVQYVTVGEHRFAVVDANDWESMIECVLEGREGLG
jgi:hypothetical protein